MGRVRSLVKPILLRNFRNYFLSIWVIVYEALTPLTMLLAFYLVDSYQRVLPSSLNNLVGSVGGGYFKYVFVGLAVSELAQSSLNGVLGVYANEKKWGSLTQIFVCGYSLRQWSIAAGIANFLRAFFRFLWVLLLGMLLSGTAFNFRLDLVLLFSLVCAVALWSLAILTLSLSVVFRRGTFFGFLFSVALDLLGGVYAPNTVFPSWLKNISEFLPITPAVRAIHALVSGGAGWLEVRADFYQILFLGSLFLPFALVVVGQADRFARRRGFYFLE